MVFPIQAPVLQAAATPKTCVHCVPMVPFKLYPNVTLEGL